MAGSISSAELQVLLTAKDQITATLAKVEGQLAKMDTGATTTAQKLDALGKAAGVAALAGIAALGVGLGLSIKAAADSQVVHAQLAAVLQSTGSAAGVTSEMANKLADELSNLSGADDEAVLGAENMLLTFTSIHKDTFPAVTKAVVNMATAMGGGAIPTAEKLRETAIQVGKAMQDPIAGATALRRVGVQLTESQQELIKSLMAVGDQEGAQRVILGELETEFGSAATAAGHTFAGQLGRLQTQIGNVQEEIGGMLLPVLGDMADSLSGWLPAAMGTFFGAARNVITVIVNLATWIGNNRPLIIGLAAAIAMYLYPSFVALLPVVWAVVTAVTAFALPIIGTGLLLGALGGAIAAVIDHWSLFEQAGAVIVQLFQQLVEWISSKVGPVFQWLADIVGRVVGWIQDRVAGLAQALGPIAEKLGLNFGGIANQASMMGFDVGAAFAAIPGLATSAVEAVGAVIPTLVSNARDAVDSIGAVVGEAVGYLTKPLTVAAEEIPVVAARFKDPLDDMDKAARSAGAGAREAAGAIHSLRGETDAAAEAAQRAADELQKALGQQGEAWFNAQQMASGYVDTQFRYMQTLDDEIAKQKAAAAAADEHARAIGNAANAAQIAATAANNQGVTNAGAELNRLRDVQHWVRQNLHVDVGGDTFAQAIAWIMANVSGALREQLLASFGAIDLTTPDTGPGFQHGGIVPGPIGAPLRATVHGGETILPVGTAYGVHIHIEGPVYGLDDLDRHIAEAWVRVARRGGFSQVLQGA